MKTPRQLIQLVVNPKDGSLLGLRKALHGVWRGERSLPPGITIKASSATALVLSVARSAFALEHDAVALLTLQPMRLAQPFLVAAKNVVGLELRLEGNLLQFYAVCSHAGTVSLEEIRRSYRKGRLPPGIHSEKALAMTGGSGKAFSGGLPSLGKRSK